MTKLYFEYMLETIKPFIGMHLNWMKKLNI